MAIQTEQFLGGAGFAKDKAMLRKTILLAAAAGTLSAQAAMAEEHVVLILHDAFFPEITYLYPGDQIRFVNTTESEANIISKNESWNSGAIAPGGTYVLAAATGVQSTFFNADVMADTDNDGVEDAYAIQGNFTFGEAPDS